jgi:MoaA/NifB/PqqE/SkfB family radical SAM enzyme
MPWAVLRSAADRLLESPTRDVELVFAGGEPLLEFDHIRRVVDYLDRRITSRRTVQYSLATNGTMLAPDVIAFLDTRGFGIQLSFDGVLPAQSVRGKRSFARIDEALDRLRVDAPAIFWKRLTVGITLDAQAVPFLAKSFAYFIEQHLPVVVISPANGQAAMWTPRVIKALERELQAVYSRARRLYDDTGRVPLTAFRKTSMDSPPDTGIVCGGATPSNVTVDVDGETYACPFLAESSQRFANQRLAATIQPMRTGHVASPAFWKRLADLPLRARDTGMFHIGPERHSLHGQCLSCPHRLECTACPLTVLAEAEHDDVQRIPDYICAFNWILMGLRKRFPVQPDAAALLEGQAPMPRLVRGLLERAGTGKSRVSPNPR